MKNNMGSYIFFAPEMFQVKTTGVKVQGEKTDIWALGVTLFVMLTGHYPSGHSTDLIDLKNKVLFADIDFNMIKNEDARDLLKIILEKNPEKRASLN